MIDKTWVSLQVFAWCDICKFCDKHKTDTHGLCQLSAVTFKASWQTYSEKEIASMGVEHDNEEEVEKCYFVVGPKFGCVHFKEDGKGGA